MAMRSASASCAGCSSSRSSTIRIRNSNSPSDDYRSPIPEKYQWRTWAADPEGITGEELLAFVNDELFPALKSLAALGQARRPPPRGARRVRGRLQLHEVRPADAAGGQQDQRRRFQQSRPSASTSATFYEQILNDLQSAGNAGEYYTPRAVTAFMADRIDPHPGEILFDPACGTGGFLTCAIRHMREALRRSGPKHERDDAGAPCARWRRSSFRTCSASPTCCCTASRTRASCATTTRWRGPTSATRKATAWTSC